MMDGGESEESDMSEQSEGNEEEWGAESERAVGQATAADSETTSTNAPSNSNSASTTPQRPSHTVSASRCAAPFNCTGWPHSNGSQPARGSCRRNISLTSLVLGSAGPEPSQYSRKHVNGESAGRGECLLIP